MSWQKSFTDSWRVADPSTWSEFLPYLQKWMGGALAQTTIEGLPPLVSDALAAITSLRSIVVVLTIRANEATIQLRSLREKFEQGTITAEELKTQSEALYRNLNQLDPATKESLYQAVLDLAIATDGRDPDGSDEDWAIWEKALIGIGAMLQSSGEELSRYGDTTRRVIESVPRLVEKGLDATTIVITAAAALAAFGGLIWMTSQKDPK